MTRLSGLARARAALITLDHSAVRSGPLAITEAYTPTLLYVIAHALVHIAEQHTIATDDPWGDDYYRDEYAPRGGQDGQP